MNLRQTFGLPPLQDLPVKMALLFRRDCRQQTMGSPHPTARGISRRTVWCQRKSAFPHQTLFDEQQWTVPAHRVQINLATLLQQVVSAHQQLLNPFGRRTWHEWNLRTTLSNWTLPPGMDIWLLVDGHRWLLGRVRIHLSPLSSPNRYPPTVKTPLFDGQVVLGHIRTADHSMNLAHP